MIKKFILILSFIPVYLLFLVSPVYAQSPGVLVLNIEGVINPFTAGYLERGLLLAEEEDAALVILTLDTPGGLETSMREMVQQILRSPVPVAVFVSPSGARAASAGLFILMAADFAVMAPTTNIGAATPIALGEEMDDVVSKKAISDAAALIRSLAEEHDRNAALVERAVSESLSFTASEALEADIIDLIASDLMDLVNQLDGRSVNGLTLELSGATFIEEDMTWVERFFLVITDPNIAYLLLSLGTIFLLAELADPGLSVAGIGALVCFGIAFMALGSLPINWVAIAMLVVSLILFVVALLTDTEVIVTIIGLVPFVIGSLLLFSPFRPNTPIVPELQVSLWLIIAMGLLIVVFSLIVLRAILKASKRPPQAGAERFIGQAGTALTDLNPEGDIEVDHQIWGAVSLSGDIIKEGQQVKVVEVSGVRLVVMENVDE
jgi:membrane-bound serine protease (ClpP class)